MNVIADKRWKRFLLLALSGILTGLTLVFPKIGFLEWLTLVPVGIFLILEADSDTRRLRGMYGYGFFFFLCFYVVVFHWFVNLYPLEFIDGMTPWAAIAVVLAGSIGLSAFQALFGGLLFVLVRLLLRTTLFTKYKMLRPFGVAGLWAVYEWTQNFVWWGVPWGRLPIGQSEYVVGLQTAALLGSYFVTFVIVLVNVCVAYVLIERTSLKAMSIVVTATLVFQYGVGTAMYFIPCDGDETVKIAAVQGNISSNEKWSAESKQRTFDVYTEYTLKAAENGADIVLWPETAFPYTVTEGNQYGKYCSQLARTANVTILVGAFSKGENFTEQYNSVICILPDGSFHDSTYSKRRLVPFGEFVPMRGLFETLIPPLAELVMTSDDILAGEDSAVMTLDKVNVGCLVCFDSIYDYLTRDSVNDGAQLICLSTNDSWFTDSAALYMHNAQAQMRAIENGRYVVRAANTGISTVISSKGAVLEELEPLVDGMVEYEVSVNTHRTLYSVIGNFFVIALVLAVASVFAYDLTSLIRKRKVMTK